MKGLSYKIEGIKVILSPNAKLEIEERKAWLEDSLKRLKAVKPKDRDEHWLHCHIHHNNSLAYLEQYILSNVVDEQGEQQTK